MNLFETSFLLCYHSRYHFRNDLLIISYYYNTFVPNLTTRQIWWFNWKVSFSFSYFSVVLSFNEDSSYTRSFFLISFVTLLFEEKVISLDLIRLRRLIVKSVARNGDRGRNRRKLNGRRISVNSTQLGFIHWIWPLARQVHVLARGKL